MIITIFANVVFVISLIMLSFYFVTANIYDMTLMDKAYISLLMGALPALVNISFKNFIATVIALLISVTALIWIAFTKFFEKEHEKEILYDCLLDDISQDDVNYSETSYRASCFNHYCLADTLQYCQVLHSVRKR